MTTFGIILGYLALLIFLGVFSGRILKRTTGDFFLASRGIGPFMLLMSVFGTTMTAFALVGSTGQTFRQGIGIYGLMASWSGIVHAAVFFFVGARIWALGKKHGYVTQISYFRDRYESNAVALILFPVVVTFVMIYILVGVIAGGKYLSGVTAELWSLPDRRTEVILEATPESPQLPATLGIPTALEGRLEYDSESRKLSLKGSIHPRYRRALLDANEALRASPAFVAGVEELFRQAPTGSLPYPVSMALICLVVLFYVFFGGMRATAWANTFQTLVFMTMGLVAFLMITRGMGGLVAATEMVARHPEASQRMARDGISHGVFLTYCLIPLSVGMFPHLFQHWLTARRGSSFKLTVVAHPLCIMITWVPCILVGMWAAAVLAADTDPNLVLASMVGTYAGEVVGGLISAGVLAAIMSSMDSQFLCLSGLFTNDIVARYFGERLATERSRVLCGRAFVVLVVAVAYLIGFFRPTAVFNLGVWCFTGFSGLCPALFASLYWRRTNKYGVIASILTALGLWLWYLPTVLSQKGFYLHFTFGDEYEVSVLPATLVVGAALVALVIVTLVTPRPPESVVRKFFGASPF